jgi:hypothetical protein
LKLTEAFREEVLAARPRDPKPHSPKSSNPIPLVVAVPIIRTLAITPLVPLIPPEPDELIALSFRPTIQEPLETVLGVLIHVPPELIPELIQIVLNLFVVSL